jgi:hypothetical protein
MYHASDAKNLNSILNNGFYPSNNGMLGKGVYLSRQMIKTLNYPMNLAIG